ncbi:hypothetical protein FACS1894187_05340 [Synergistales bacterium]|nr:hypothetical protein FACS1894187_05340 [Synergistales bacterium]
MRPSSFEIDIVNFITKAGELGASEITTGWVNIAALVGAGVSVVGSLYGWGSNTVNEGKANFYPIKFCSVATDNRHEQ